MFKSIVKKVIENAWIARSFHKTLYFNFKYLPFKQAIKLPILLYKPHFNNLSGHVEIHSSHIKRGMIILGKYCANIYPNNGIQLDIRGDLMFDGNCIIGNDSYISISDNGTLFLGDNLRITSSVKLVCYNKIKIGDNVLIGWQCLMCDNDFHSIIDLTINQAKRITKPIEIGNHVWIANSCSLIKGALVPSNSVVASHSLVNKDMGNEENILIAGSPAVVKKHKINWTF